MVEKQLYSCFFYGMAVDSYLHLPGGSWFSCNKSVHLATRSVGILAAGEYNSAPE